MADHPLKGAIKFRPIGQSRVRVFPAYEAVKIEISNNVETLASAYLDKSEAFDLVADILYQLRPKE